MILPWRKKKELTLFISYSHRDSFLARLMEIDLSYVGFSVFIDYQSIQIGERLSKVIKPEIARSQFFLVLLSYSSLKSKWVEQEFDWALAHDCEIFAVDIDQNIDDIVFSELRDIKRCNRAVETLAFAWRDILQKVHDPQGSLRSLDDIFNEFNPDLFRVANFLELITESYLRYVDWQYALPKFTLESCWVWAGMVLQKGERGEYLFIISPTHDLRENEQNHADNSVNWEGLFQSTPISDIVQNLQAIAIELIQAAVPDWTPDLPATLDFDEISQYVSAEEKPFRSVSLSFLPKATEHCLPVLSR